MKDIYLRYFDLSEGLITTVNDYSKPSYCISITQGSFITNNGPNAIPNTIRNCGHTSMKCFINAYSDHGWTSLWLSLQTAFIPETAAAIAAGCVGRNCF